MAVHEDSDGLKEWKALLEPIEQREGEKLLSPWVGVQAWMPEPFQSTAAQARTSRQAAVLPNSRGRAGRALCRVSDLHCDEGDQRLRADSPIRCLHLYLHAHVHATRRWKTEQRGALSLGQQGHGSSSPRPKRGWSRTGSPAKPAIARPVLPRWGAWCMRGVGSWELLRLMSIGGL